MKNDEKVELLREKHAEFIKKVCLQLKCKREALGLDQIWVSKQVGIHQSRLSEIENGKISDLKISQLNRLMEVLGIQYENIVGKAQATNINYNKGDNNVVGENISVNKITSDEKISKMLVNLLEENHKLREENKRLQIEKSEK